MNRLEVIDAVPLTTVMAPPAIELPLVAAEALVEGSPALFTIGVTDLVFNPVIAVYELALKTPDGQKVSPAFWNQYTKECIDEYWDFVK